MAKQNTITAKEDVTFRDFLKDIRVERLRNGMDKEPIKLPKLQKALTRVPKLKEILINSTIKNV